jgi:hypothetical protein
MGWVESRPFDAKLGNPEISAGGSFVDIVDTMHNPLAGIKQADERGEGVPGLMHPGPSDEGILLYAGATEPEVPPLARPGRQMSTTSTTEAALSTFGISAGAKSTTATPSVGSAGSNIVGPSVEDADAGQRYHAAGLDVAGGANRQASSATRVLAGALQSSHVKDAFFAQNDNTGLSW